MIRFSIQNKANTRLASQAKNSTPANGTKLAAISAKIDKERGIVSRYWLWTIEVFLPLESIHTKVILFSNRIASDFVSYRAP